VAADDLPMPAYEGGGLDDHQAVQQLCLLHSGAREQQSQLLSTAEASTFAQLALQDQHLLAEGQDLSVTIMTEQAGEQGSKRRTQDQNQTPEHARRMRGLNGEVNTGAEGSLTAAGGPQRAHRLVLGPHGRRTPDCRKRFRCGPGRWPVPLLENPG
jgi:hypothetical protein